MDMPPQEEEHPPPVFSELLLDVTEEVCTLTLNRPHKRNALTPTLVTELCQALAWAKRDPGVGSVILQGAGGAFCAGADLTAFQQAKATKEDQQASFVDLNLAFTSIGKPVIAKIERYALAGGLGIACACHFAVAEDTAEFSTPEINRGLFPMMIMANIFRLLPRRKGLELVLLGERFSAQQAANIGLINQAVPKENLEETCMTLAKKLAQKPSHSLRLGMEAFYAQSDMDYKEALYFLEGELNKCLQTPDAMEGIFAFMQKRDPVWPKRGH